jgi:hypothetical protein
LSRSYWKLSGRLVAVAASQMARRGRRRGRDSRKVAREGVRRRRGQRPRRSIHSGSFERPGSLAASRRARTVQVRWLRHLPLAVEAGLEPGSPARRACPARTGRAEEVVVGFDHRVVRPGVPRALPRTVIGRRRVAQAFPAGSWQAAASSRRSRADRATGAARRLAEGSP